MQTSTDIDQLAAALVAARAEFGSVHKDTANTFFKSRYASLAAIAGATLPALSANGISVIQGGGRADEAGLEVQTRLVHISGQWLETAFWIPMVGHRRKDSSYSDPVTPQSAGSAFTYARRYSLAAALGIVADEDDDAEVASSGARDAQRGERAAAKSGSSGPEPLTLPGKPSAWGGQGGEALDDCSDSALNAFISWCETKPDLAIRYGAWIDAASEILEDRAVRAESESEGVVS